MNKPEYYTRQKDGWNDAEVRQLRAEYMNDKMTISEIGDLHQRTPGSISYKLKALGYIDVNTSARGYSEYKSSQLYKDIVAKGELNPSPYVKKPTDLNITVKVDHTEIASLREDVASLKQDVTEILRILHAIYEVESQRQ